MRIARVEPLLMSHVFPEPLRLPFYGGERTILKRDAMVIRVTTDTGLTGHAPGPAHEEAARQIEGAIGPYLIDRDPRRWETFDFDGDASSVKTYHAVEIALLDLVARYEGCPVCDLVGGRKRDRIKLYGSAGMYMSPDGYAAEAAAIARMGFPAYKMRPALGPDDDLETVARMREAVGGDVGLMIDAHAWWRMGDRSYSYETVSRLAGEIAEHQPVWLEEPLPPDDHDAYRRLRAEGRVPLASGEHEQEERGFFDLIETSAVDYVQMDVCCQGGFKMGRRVFEAAARRGVKVAFHSWGTCLEVLAAAHLGVCFAEEAVEWLEYPCYSNQGRVGMYPFPIADEILEDPLPIERGFLEVPKEPGLGIKIWPKTLERYPFRPGPWSYFRTDSPAETIAVTGDHSVKWISEEDQRAET